MSQDGIRSSPRTAKSPSSRIPVFGTGTTQRKRPASHISEKANAAATKPAPVASSATTTSTPKALAGFRRLEALAKADAKARLPNAQGQSAATSGAVSCNPWVEKHLPKSLDELFVHKKKVEDVVNWLNKAIKSKHDKICILNGPAGCGKTATIFLVAKQLEVDVKEWKNPMSLTDRVFIPGDFEARRDEVQVRSELELFKDFLEINSHYRVLPINGRKMKTNRIIVVEDLPNTLYRDPNTFHQILRNYSKTGSFPLVFIITDSSNSDHSMYKMFPKSILTELNLQNISFNPVASSLMVKFLLEICARESRPVDKSQVEEIAATANGDLRCAVNNLQFFLTKERGSGSGAGFRKPPPPKRSRANNKRNSLKSASSEIQQKDDTIQLFKALGKVLYAKRDETTVSEIEMELKGQLEVDRRIHPLLEDPDNISCKLEVLPATFLGFLHQNYPPFFGSIDELQIAAEHLSTSDFILSGWKFDDSGTSGTFKARDMKDQLSMNIAIRGLMHSNNNRVSNSWKPLTKPSVSNLDTYTRDKVEATRQSLYHLGELQATLFTETIPLYAKLIQLKPSFVIDGRKEIVEKGLFKHKFIRFESLDEKETVEDAEGSASPEESEDVSVQPDADVKRVDLKSPSSKNNNLDNNLREDFVIEDFDD